MFRGICYGFVVFLGSNIFIMFWLNIFAFVMVRIVKF
jgi:hypothetical protein